VRWLATALGSCCLLHSATQSDTRTVLRDTHIRYRCNLPVSLSARQLNSAEALHRGPGARNAYLAWRTPPLKGLRGRRGNGAEANRQRGNARQTTAVAESKRVTMAETSSSQESQQRKI
jgi:hypothetical protein